MPKSRIPSPARSQGAITTPRRNKPRGSRSVCSPALSTASGRLTSVIDQFKDKNLDSFALSPLNSRLSVLNDDTDIEEPRRKSWWKKLNENSRDVMEVLEEHKEMDVNNIEELVDIEILSQERKNHTLDLPDSSDNESINSIVLPQRKLFTQKENQPQKKFGQLVGTRETLAKLHKTNNTTQHDKTINAGTKELFQGNKRTKPIFPAALLNISPNKTVADKTKENIAAEPKAPVRSIFGNRPANKRKNIFADFIVSESEDEISEIQPKVFGFQKKVEQRRISSISKGRDQSPMSSITADMELDEWQQLPSSTMVEKQLEAEMVAGHTPVKRARLSKLFEDDNILEDEHEVQSTESPKKANKSLNRSNKSLNRSKRSQNKSNRSINRSTRSQKLETPPKVSKVVEESQEKEHSAKDNIDGVLQNKSSDEKREDNDEQQMEIETQALQNNKSKKSMLENVLEDPEDEMNENEELEQENDEANDDAGDQSTVNVSKKDKTANKSQVAESKDNTSDEQIVEGHEIECEQDDEESNEEFKYESDENDKIIDSRNANKTNESQIETNESNEAEKVDENEDEEILEDQDEIEKSNESVEVTADKSEEMQTNEKTDENIDQEMEDNENEEVTAEDNAEESAENNSEQSLKGNVNQTVEENDDQIQETDEVNDDANNEDDEEKSKEIEDDDADESQKVNDEVNESQEIDEEVNESQVADDDANDSQEEDDEANESQEINVEVNESAEANDEVHESREDNGENESEEQNEVNQSDDDDDDQNQVSLNEAEENEEENNESQEVENESQEIENDEADESQEIENDQQVENDEADESEEIENDEADESQEIENDEANESLEVENDEANESQETEKDEAEQSQETENEEANESQEMENIVESDDNRDDNEMDDSADDRAVASDDMSDQEQEEMEVDEDQNDEIMEVEPQSAEIIEGSLNATHDTTGRNRKKIKSPEVILHDKTNQMNSFTAKGRNTSIRKTKSMYKDLNIRPSLAPIRDSIGLSDGTRDSSAEGSGWDSHRTTRKTLRQTFGKDFSVRKSLRALVMEKSAKQQTENLDLHSDTVKFPQANSTEYPEDSNREVNVTVESNHEVSFRTRQTTLENYLQKIKEQNIEKKNKMEQAIRNSLKAPARDTLSLFKVPSKPPPRRPKPVANKPKKQTKSAILFDELPTEVIEDMKYKPPKRFRPSNASWITKKLYKFLESKLEPKYDYKARVRAEKLVETIYHFAKDLRRHEVAPSGAVDILKQELARLDIVKTHFEFYEFFHEFMPREVRVKVVPDIVNKIPLPRHGVFTEILRGNTVQG